MIPLNSILTLPVCSDFHVVSGFNGISNNVGAVEFFDCEPNAIPSPDTAGGKLIVTTLAAAHDNALQAEAYLKMLLLSGVAAVAVRSTYFDAVSGAIRQLSDERNVPLIFFASPGVDDVLYHIRFQLDHATQEDMSAALSLLLNGKNLSSERVLDLAYRLNPFFYDAVVRCSYVTGPYGASTFACAPAFRQEGDSIFSLPSGNIRYAFIPYKRGQFFILTAERPEELPADFGERLLKSLLPPDTNGTQRVGHSSTAAKLSQLHIPLCEALYANASSVLDDFGVTYYDQLRLDKLLCSATAIEVAKELYDDLTQKLARSGGKNNAEDFNATLDTYVACNGDVKSTAVTLHQHPNTIRYRLSKIQSAWSCSDTFSFNGTAMIFVRLRGILHLLDAL